MVCGAFSLCFVGHLLSRWSWEVHLLNHSSLTLLNRGWHDFLQELMISLLLTKKWLVALGHLKLFVRRDSRLAIALQIVKVLEEGIHGEVLGFVLMHT